VIKDEIGDNLFSVLIDESRDISIAEQMAVIVRLVDVCLLSCSIVDLILFITLLLHVLQVCEQRRNGC